MNETFVMMIHQNQGDEVKRRLASNLRRLRIAGRLSQSELARITSMSKATLSGIERGRGNPTVDTLASLAGALRASIAELLVEPELGEVRIVRASRTVPFPNDRVAKRELEDPTQASGEVELCELSLPARHVHEMAPRTRGSRVGVLVLSGQLIAGPKERISELGQGDFMSFPADVPHVYEAQRAPTSLLVIEHPPSRA
jgi:transcriptional regulator with XRE-family HTH domain